MKVWGHGLAPRFTAASPFVGPPHGLPVTNSKKLAAFPPDGLPVSFVVISGELPRGALAVVQIRPRGLEQAFIVFSEFHITDRLIMRAHGSITRYRIQHPEDTGTVEFWLLPDGRLETHSASRGQEVGTHVPLAETVSGDEHMTQELRERISNARPTEFPGFGTARVVPWTTPRDTNR